MASQTWDDFLKSKGVDSSSSGDGKSQLQQPDYGVLGALGGAYGAFANGGAMSDAYGASASSAEQQANQLQQQMQNMPTLASMYGPDSSYAKQLQATLAAKDAAAGRNSQYGQRAVTLQAALADKGSQYAAQQAQMANQYSQAQTAANQARTQATLGQQQVQAQQLGSLFNVADKTGLLGKANNSLAGLYQQYFPSNSSSVPMGDSPYAGGGDYTGYTTGSDNNPLISYQSNGGMGQMYGAPDTNYTQGMDTSQAPTSSDNSYYQPNWE